MTYPEGKENKIPNPPYKLAGLGVLVILVIIVALVYLQFRGDFTPKVHLQMLSARAGLVMDPGSKVTYNGVEIGKVAEISEVTRDGKPAAKFSLDVYPKYLKLIPQNVRADIRATTLFGGKYVSLTSPKHPTPQRISPQHVIDARSVTTEINTVFQTIASLSQQVDPVKLNLTLSAAAEALSGLGDKFGQSIVNANAVLDNVNPQQPRVRRDIQQFAALADTFANSAPNFFDFLSDTVITARTLNRQQSDLDAALMSAVGFGNTVGDVIQRGGPYLDRGAADLVPTAKLLDEYSPELFCTIRNYHDIEPKVAAFTGASNGYSLRTDSELLSGASLLLNPSFIFGSLLFPGLLLASPAAAINGAPNPYIYPENLPRVNTKGGPGGAPGCWQPITRDFWPAPYLVMDSGNSVAPYNHLEVGSPYAIEYVWGRQVGDNTINP
ncbi:MAG: MCE family protein [Mycobacterium sp.]|uniref:MCE family protein n=1 Tax=Mycobacterium sp. TaxID=1785 RepID=UPI003CC65354